LLCDGGCPSEFTAQDVDHSGHDGLRIDAPVLVKPLILGGNEGLLDGRRDAIIRYRRAILTGVPRQLFPVGGVRDRGLLHAGILQAFGGRDVVRQRPDIASDAQHPDENDPGNDRESSGCLCLSRVRELSMKKAPEAAVGTARRALIGTGLPTSRLVAKVFVKLFVGIRPLGHSPAKW